MHDCGYVWGQGRYLEEYLRMLVATQLVGSKLFASSSTLDSLLVEGLSEKYFSLTQRWTTI